MEKDPRVIGIIIDEELAKESKDMGRRCQAIVSKEKEKEASEIENLTHLIKSLTTGVYEFKKWTSGTTMNSWPPRFAQEKNSAFSNSSHLEKVHRYLTLCSTWIQS